MTAEKMSYIIAGTVGVLAILGGVWSSAVATTNLTNQIAIMDTTLKKNTSGYKRIMETNAILVSDVADLKRGALELLYASHDHLMVRLSDGTLLRIPMERVKDGQIVAAAASNTSSNATSVDGTP